MDKQDYIDSLKQLNLRPKKVKVEHKEQVIMEKEEYKEEILSEIFVQSSEIAAMPPGKDRDMQICRLSMIAELDASNLYEKLANLASDKKLAKVLRDVSEEEKVHAGEFESMLNSIDPEHKKALKDGEDEVKDI